MNDTIALQRSKLQRAGSLRWVHWCALSLSVLTTLGLWALTSKQMEQRNQGLFDREAQRVVELVQERVQKYENVLWSGVAMIDMVGVELTNEDWGEYSQSLCLDDKYPEVNGIGLIYRVAAADLPWFLDRQREQRPEFRIQPVVERNEYLPVTFVEPAASNAQAVGLDMAHEARRLEAAIRARDSGQAQITAPLALVQTEAGMPGFHLYAPFYSTGDHSTIEARRASFSGMVYATFVVTNLMKGTLAQGSRHVGFRITNHGETLYDELTEGAPDYDRIPLYRLTRTVSMYGRDWTFEIQSGRSFRATMDHSQPATILVAGTAISLLLIGLFVLTSRAHRSSLDYAELATAELAAKAHALEESNQELEQFAYVASHDLQEPLRMVGSFAKLLDDEYGDHFDERGSRWLGFMVDGARRMQDLVQGLLEYSRVGRGEKPKSPIETNRLVDQILLDLQQSIEESNAVVTRDELPAVMGHEQQLRLVFQNLISNSIKFHAEGVSPEVRVGVRQQNGECTFFVSDNGIGIEPQYAEQVFGVFQRLHTQTAYPGTGIGLAISKKVVESHGGKLWLHSSADGGTTFEFTLGMAIPSSEPLPPLSGRTNRSVPDNDQSSDRHSASRGQRRGR